MDKKHCIIVLLILGFVTRLPFLNHPNEVIFDEVHYGKFADAYVSTGSYFFDVHPPWGKLIPALFLKISGYPGHQSFEKIGLHYEQASAVVVRLFACTLGSLTPFIAFAFLFLLGAGLPASFFGGLLFAFDNALILQSRVLMLYAPLIFFQLTTLVFMLLAFRDKNFFLWMALSGFAGGLALGTQFTGLTASAVAGIVFLVMVRRHGFDLKKAGLGALAFWGSFAFLYLLGFYLHFALLPGAGPGDAFYQRTHHFWPDLIALHKVMYSASATLTTSHPDMSPWYHWPFMTKPIFYWIENGASIYFLGNPVLWTIGSLFLFYALFFWPKPKKRHPSLWIPFLLFAVAFIPLTLMSRVMFLYHYLVPILFGSLYLVLWMESKKWIPIEWQNLHWKHYAVVALLVLGYFWIFPITYGVHAPDFLWKSLPWTVYH